MRIDPHVHCRDGKQAYKTTIADVFKLADSQGVQKIFDMPNTDPPIVSEADVEARLKLVPPSRLNDYFLYVGITANPKQIVEAAQLAVSHPRVAGLKMFAGRSVGDLAVIEDEQQAFVYQTLVKSGYKGVIAVHCEREANLRPELWKPEMPITHCQARPEEGEVESAKRQLRFAAEAGVAGTLHIPHISSPDSIFEIIYARENFNMQCRATCGVTPHHIMWDQSVMNNSDGLAYKMNPSLRNKVSVGALREKMLAGQIDWIETDHAPHALWEKFGPPHLSGYPSMTVYRYFVEQFLPGIGMSAELIRRMTCDNIMAIFGDKLK